MTHRLRPVLVVEDDEILREAVRVALEEDGLVVIEAADGLHALAQATATEPSLVVLDMGLPGLDGQGVAEALRTRYGRDLPILLMTADGRPVQKAERVGAYAYVTKPFDIDGLLTRVWDGLPADMQ
jgi:two-component system OmpR family response regulator